MKNKIHLVLLLAFLAFVSSYYGSTIKQNALGVSNGIVGLFLDFKDYMSYKTTKHIEQAETIEKLRTENDELREYKLLYIAQSGKLGKLLEDKNSTMYEPRVKLSRTLSYLELGDSNKFFIDYQNIDKNKIYGLVYDAKTIGIAKEHLGKSLAILQSDDKCAFSVYIGEYFAPGIASGNGGNINVKFIPKWIKIKKGDKVITSGLDDIFFYGVDVGEVISVNEDDAYQNAIVKPFNLSTPPSFVYVVERVK